VRIRRLHAPWTGKHASLSIPDAAHAAVGRIPEYFRREKAIARSRFVLTGSFHMYLAAASVRVGGTTRSKRPRLMGGRYTKVLVLCMMEEVHEKMISEPWYCASG
jgi:hypothetical protein